MYWLILGAIVGVVVGSLGSVGRCDRVEGVAATEVHVLETVLDLVGHFRHMSGEEIGSAHEKTALSIIYIACKALSAILGSGMIYL